VKYAFRIAVVVVVLVVGWKFLQPVWANFELQDDLHDLAAQTSSRIGLSAPPSDDGLRDIVINKAARYDIQLDPRQVTVRRSGTAEAPVFYIAADYTVPVSLPGYTFTLHFTASSTGHGL